LNPASFVALSIQLKVKLDAVSFTIPKFVGVSGGATGPNSASRPPQAANNPTAHATMPIFTVCLMTIPPSGDRRQAQTFADLNSHKYTACGLQWLLFV
jgi:hypothetical protein